MRRGFDRLSQTAKDVVGVDPQQGGALFVFANRRASRIKVLWFERNGYCMLYKRLHRAVFELPIAGVGCASVHIDAAALASSSRAERRKRRALRNSRRCARCT
jgi:transposase